MLEDVKWLMEIGELAEDEWLDDVEWLVQDEVTVNDLAMNDAGYGGSEARPCVSRIIGIICIGGRISMLHKIAELQKGSDNFTGMNSVTDPLRVWLRGRCGCG